MAVRLWVLSDLHVDVASWELPEPRPQVDVIVIAGDVCERLAERVLPWLETKLAKGIPVVYVPGNHDFYTRNAMYEIEKARAVLPTGVILLAEGETHVEAGVRFIGATLWTDYKLRGDVRTSALLAAERMRDHKKIRYGACFAKFSPRDAHALHDKQLARIVAALEQPHEGPTIVVSHHAPTALSLAGGVAADPLDASYASALDDVIERYSPDVWIHGHVHVKHDYQHHRTRVVANPRGYITSKRMHGRVTTEVENPDFDPALVVEVAPR